MTTIQNIPFDILKNIASFVVEPSYKLLSWLNIKNLYEYSLCYNPCAIEWIEKNINKTSWFELSENPNAIHLLEKNLDKVDWMILSNNPNAIPILEKNIEMINWCMLSQNSNPKVISLIEKHKNNLVNYYVYLSRNPVIFEVDSNGMDKKLIQFARILCI